MNCFFGFWQNNRILATFWRLTTHATFWRLTTHAKQNGDKWNSCKIGPRETNNAYKLSHSLLISVFFFFKRKLNLCEKICCLGSWDIRHLKGKGMRDI